MVRVFFDHDLLKKNKSKGKFRDFIKREKLLNVEDCEKLDEIFQIFSSVSTSIVKCSAS